MMDPKTLESYIQVVILRSKDYSFPFIEKETGVPKSTAYYVWNKFRKFGSVLGQQSNSGVKSKLTKKIAKKISTAIQRCPDITTQELQKKYVKTVSVRTLRRYRNKLGYSCVKGMPVTPLTPDQRKKRKSWCSENRNNQMEDVIWTDEKLFEVGRVRKVFWCKRGTPRPTYVKFKSSYKVLIWGGISRRGQTPICYVDSTINGPVYTDILKKCLLPFGESKFQTAIDYNMTIFSTHCNFYKEMA